MKIPTSNRKRGFTLIELLIVVAIIATLAAAGFAGGMKLIERAKKMTTLSTCTAIETAVNNFYTEYGTMPYEDTSSGSTAQTDDNDPILTNTPEGIILLEHLLGLDTTINTRGLKLLDVKAGKGRKDGLIYDSADSSASSNARVIGLYDPWGGPYNIQLDTNYDEIVKPKPLASAEKTLHGKHVAVWSNGADWESQSSRSNDDVITW